MYYRHAIVFSLHDLYLEWLPFPFKYKSSLSDLEVLDLKLVLCAQTTGRRETGFTKTYKLSPELAEIVGAEAMPRHEVVKRMWAIIKERNLYDPKNKQFAICDDQLLKVFGKVIHLKFLKLLKILN